MYNAVISPQLHTGQRKKAATETALHLFLYIYIYILIPSGRTLTIPKCLQGSRLATSKKISREDVGSMFNTRFLSVYIYIYISYIYYIDKYTFIFIIYIRK